MASKRNGTIYLGVTSNIVQRAYQHRNGLIEGFTKEHECKFLVWYEKFENIQEARECEHRMKKWKRDWKLTLIEKQNPLWDDLYETLFL
jgi:putative endonuclease